MKNYQSINGFTVVELMIVVIILGIAAVFAGVDFDKSRNRAEESSAVRQLESIRGSMKIYFAKEGVTRIPNTGRTPDYDVAQLNKLLNLSIMEPTNMTLGCYDNNGGVTNDCQFVHSDGWIVELHDSLGVILGSNTHCTNGACPFCLIEGSGGCP